MAEGEDIDWEDKKWGKIMTTAGFEPAPLTDQHLKLAPYTTRPHCLCYGIDVSYSPFKGWLGQSRVLTPCKRHNIDAELRPSSGYPI